MVMFSNPTALGRMFEKLFEPISLGRVEFRNRLWVPPMCQYSAPNGVPTAWHIRHYGSLALATGCVVVEATAVSNVARVTPEDLVLSHESDLSAFGCLASAIAASGAIPGIQLCHAGRKGSRSSPWNGDLALYETEGGWPLYGPSSIPFGENYETPIELQSQELKDITDSFASSAALAERAGFKLIEIHAAHGRLIHSFLSSLSNRREDDYGGSLNNRVRFLVDIIKSVKSRLSENMVVAVRLSCVDWIEGGLDIDQTLEISKILKAEGVELIDCSSGGIQRPLVKKIYPGYQVGFARAIRNSCDIAAGAVGAITTAEAAEQIIASGDADIVFIGRQLIADPQYMLRVAAEADRWDLVPKQYHRALKQMLKLSQEHIPEL